MKTLKITTLTTFLLTALAFSGFRRPADDYEKEIRAFHQKRIEGLKKENGWLNLAGLFWLEAGENTFGSDPSNELVFPKGKSDDFLGKLILKNDAVVFESQAEQKVSDEKGLPVSQLKVFPSEKPEVLKHKSLQWTIIKRGDKYGVRLRDLESEELKNFKDIDTYPVDRKWKVKAAFVPSNGRQIPILDVLGQTSLQDSPGRLVFTIKGKSYNLDAVGTTDELFIIFGDKTNKKETYGAGRFLYSAVESDGSVYLDFNKAINPPCAFTPFATCPLPPKQNLLEVSINAGEKNYSYH